MAQGTNAPVVDLGRVTITNQALAAMEQAVYQAADTVNRLLRDGPPFTKGLAGEIKFPEGGQ